MRVLCSALYIFLAISADAFVVGPKNAALSTQRIQTLTPLFMSDAPEATDSEEVAVEESAPAPAATDSASDSDATDEKPAYPKERHTIYVGNLPYGKFVLFSIHDGSSFWDIELRFFCHRGIRSRGQGNLCSPRSCSVCQSST